MGKTKRGPATNEALRRSEELLQRVTDFANDAIVLVGSAGQITYCNPAGERMFGYAAGELPGKDVRSLLQATRYASLEDRILCPGEQGVDQGDIGTIEMRGLKSDGRAFPVEASISLVPDNGQQVTEVILRDISERMMAQAIIEKQTEELKNLIDVAAHELRQPATIFKGYSYLLLEKRDSLSSQAFDDALRNIAAAATRVTRLVNDLFDASRIERGKLEIKRKEVRPGKLIIRAVAEMRVSGCGRDFVMLTHREDIELWADPEKIKQVLWILLDNADKFSPRETNVEIWHESSGAQVVFHVADRGPGVPEEKREALFERFYQGEYVPRHSTPGIGLGLYIARTIVNAHGGWIEVRPRESGGSDFCFGVPTLERPSDVAPERHGLLGAEPRVRVGSGCR